VLYRITNYYNNLCEWEDCRLVVSPCFSHWTKNKLFGCAVVHLVEDWILLGYDAMLIGREYSSLLQNVGNHFSVITLLVQWILCCWNSSQNVMISMLASSYACVSWHIYINTRNKSDSLHSSTILLHLCSTVACFSHYIAIFRKFV
jgi:hypothetical protein